MALSLDGTSLVGSIAPLGAMLPRVLAWLDRDWVGTARVFATTAADLLGLGERKGRIAPGCDADLVLADAEGRVRRVWVGGREIPVEI